MRYRKVALVPDKPAIVQVVRRTTVERLAVTVEEAAQLLGVSRATLYKLVMRGEIESFTIGRSRRIAFAVLERYMGAGYDTSPIVEGIAG